MIDLVLTNKDGFVEIGQTTTSENTMLSQMYIIYFLTEIGSFSADTSFGNPVNLRNTTPEYLKVYLQKINNGILSDRIRTIDILEISINKDSIYIKVSINKEETVELTI